MAGRISAQKAPGALVATAEEIPDVKRKELFELATEEACWEWKVLETPIDDGEACPEGETIPPAENVG